MHGSLGRCTWRSTRFPHPSDRRDLAFISTIARPVPTPIRLILIACFGALSCVALVFFGAALLAHDSPLGFVLFGAAVLGMAAMAVVLVIGIILALRALYRQPELRSWGNLAITAVGLAGLAVVVYMLLSTATERGAL